MKKKSPSPIEEFLALSDAEKEAEYEKYEKGIDPAEWRPLTPAERKLWAKAKRRMGRPVVGAGAKPVSITLERGLLKRADRFAKRHKLKRSQMIAKGLELLMAG